MAEVQEEDDAGKETEPDVILRISFEVRKGLTNDEAGEPVSKMGGSYEKWRWDSSEWYSHCGGETPNK